MASQAVKCSRDGPVPHPSLAFQLKCERESEKLRARLKKQLQNDMLNLFHEKTFANLTLIAEDQQRISAHSALLKVRAPRFYNHCLVALDNHVTQPKNIIELPGLNGAQLREFIRTIYCGEETEAEEAAILDLLSRAELDSCVRLNAQKQHLKEINESRKMEIVSDPNEDRSPPNSNHRFAFAQPSDNDGNYELEEYSSFSEGLNCNGTLADLTDPFSASASDLMNVSTLNANDDVSIISAEEFVGSDAFDASEPFQVEGLDDPRIALDVENIAFLEADQMKLGSAEKSEVLSGSSVHSFDLEVNLMEPVAVEETRNNLEFFEPDIHEGSCLEMDISTQKEEGELFQVIGIRSTSDDYEKLALGTYAGTKVSADENHLMIRSNESKDCDSGVCCSISRKLSTSSVPCCSEHLQDSPTGSLPKDDSLEFCPDSLTSDDTPQALQPAPFGDTLMDIDWNVNAAYQLDLTKEGMKRRFEAGFSEDRGVAPKKQAWPDDGSLEGLEKRRWSTSCCESQPKSILKPSAVVPPYNADYDAKNVLKGSAGGNMDSTYTMPHPSPQTAQWLSSATNPNLTQGQRITDPGSSKHTVQLDFVPFLEERMANNIDADSKTPLGAASVEIGGVSSLDVEYLLTIDACDGDSMADQLAAKDLSVATDSKFIPGFYPETRDKESDFAYGREGIFIPDNPEHVLITTVQNQSGTSLISEMKQDIPTSVQSLGETTDDAGFVSSLKFEMQAEESGLDVMKPDVTEHGEVDNVAVRSRSGTFETSPSHEQEVHVSDLLESESGEELREGAAETLDNGKESQAHRPEGYFVFIDVSDPVPPAIKSGPDKGTATQTVSPRKKPAEAFFFVPSDDKLEDVGLPEQPAVVAAAAATESPAPKAVAAVAAHQPVYMYIEATSPTSSTNSGHSMRHSRLGERKGPVLRRRPRTSANAQRPKSESAATLLEDASKILCSEKSSKRASLAFGDEEDATYSLTSAGKELVPEEVRVPSPNKWCSRLGRDLLRMFLDEIETDVVIRVDGKDIKAHKSVLTSRCVYFAAMLSGGWVESSGNVIKMQGFSYDAVHFALCHIYGGSTCVPDNIEVSELASLSDMLGLEGLKEVVALALKMKYCHFFHKPCSTCTTSVSECLLIATSFGLDELQEKCLKWITRHMMKAWPTKAFAALPEEILQKCYCAAKIEIVADTVLDTLLRCDKLMATLPHVKWTEPVFSLTSRLAETASAYLATHFPSVLSSSSFLALRSGQSWSIHALETTFLLAIDRLPLDCACQAYVRLHGLLNDASQMEVLESADVNENFDALLSKIHRQVELFLIHNANRIVRCNSWSLLTPDLQKKIKDAAVIVFEFGKPTAPPPQLSSLNRKFTRTRASNSTSSASPTIERARVSSNASSLRATTKGDAPGIQRNVDSKAEQRDSGGPKAATLPRAKEVTRKAAPHNSQQRAISEAVGATQNAARSRHHVGSHTLPNTKTSEIRKRAESDANRRQSATTLQAAYSSKNVQISKVASSDTSSSGHTRPKSWPVRDKPIASTMSKSKDKTPMRESPRETKPTMTSSLTLRSTSRQSTLTNGNSKPTTPTAPRPKSAVYNGGAGRSAKQVCNGNVRDSKASNLRKAASSDLHGKENIDEIRPRSATRPRSEDVSSPSGKRGGLRPASMRTSRLTTTSKP